MGTSLLCAKQAPPWDGAYGSTMSMRRMQTEKGPGTRGGSCTAGSFSAIIRYFSYIIQSYGTACTGHLTCTCLPG